MKGRATVISVDCTEAAKMCKKLKMSPKPNLLNHYNNGEFNKQYDRKQTEESMVMFLQDPMGDVPWSEEEASKDVMHLDYQSFKRLLRKTELPILTMFYAPWCGHCKRMKPEFNGAATAMKGRALLVGVNSDGSQGTGPSQEYNVSSFPTILYFEKGTFKYKFTGQRTKDGMISWLENPTEDVKEAEKKEETTWADEDNSPVAHLTTDTFKPFIAEHSSVLVMFYAPWCGHCKSMKPEYSKSAIRMAEEGVEGKLAAVDVTTNRPLGDEFGVKGFPTVVYFKNGNKTFEHPGLRKEPDIMKFMKDPKEPPAPAPEEASWSEQESSVEHFTTTDFEKAVKRKKHSLIMFYAPWCGHCKKAKPEFTGAAEQLADNNKVMLGAVDCTAATNKEVCSKYGVKGYPTLVYLSYGAMPHKYAGGRDQAAFVKSMSSDDPSAGMTPLEGPSGDKVVWGGEHVTHVATADHDTFLAGGTPAFMLYYKKGCSTCKSVQDAFSAASKLLKYHSITFSAFQCPPRSHNPHCSGNEPRIVVYYSASRHVVYKHSTSSSRDMVNFINAAKDEL